MKKTTKGAIAAVAAAVLLLGGAIAAVAAAVLLLGGAGSLAYWSAEGTITGGNIEAGSLKLTNQTCSSWTHVVGDGSVEEIVPGDQITKNCTYTLEAKGDHISATLTAPDAVKPTNYTDDGGDQEQTGSTLNLDVATVYTNNGGSLTSGDKVTAADDGHTIKAAITVTFPYGSTTENFNDTQNLTTTLDDIAISLKQDQLAANPS